MVEDEDAFTEAPWRQEQSGQTFFELEIRGYRLLQNARLSREERQMVLAGTRNDTENTAIVTQLRGAWDDEDLRGRDRIQLKPTSSIRLLPRTNRLCQSKMNKLTRGDTFSEA